MKQSKNLLFTSIVLATIMTSCASLDIMKSIPKSISYAVTPATLEEHNGIVPMTMKLTIPSKTWNKKISAVITPVLEYDGGQTEYPSITVYGEAVPGNGQKISFTNGGQISYAAQSIEFNDKMRVSDLIVKIKFIMGDKDFTITSKELGLDPLVKGVIVTSPSLLIDEKPVTGDGKD